MSKILLTLSFYLVLSGCFMMLAPFSMHGNGSSTGGMAHSHDKDTMTGQTHKVKAAGFFGGSMVIHMPSDTKLSQDLSATESPGIDGSSKSMKFYKQDYEAIKNAIEKSNILDDVVILPKPSYLRYSKNHGYRYLLVNNNDGTWTVFDLYLNKDETIWFTNGLDNFVYIIKDTISRFENSRSTKSISSSYEPVREKLEYNDATGRGKLSVYGKGIDARSWMLNKIGEIAASKNVLLKSGEKPQPGHFFVLNEKIENNVFTIEFEVTY